MFECVTTHYETLQTCVGHNATRYHNFNALPNVLLSDLLKKCIFKNRKISEKVYGNACGNAFKLW